MEPNLQFVESLYQGIQATIARMRAENKFNGYRYNTYPWLVRGSETEPSPYQNFLWNVENVSWDMGSVSSTRYKFTFSVYLLKYMDIKNTKCKLDLIVDFWQSEKEPKLDVFLHIDDLGRHRHTQPYKFDWKSLFDKGFSIDHILEDFQHTFLEIPPIELCRESTGALCISYLDENKFYNLYQILREFHQSKPLRQLAIGMMNHRRLAQNSSASGLSSDVLSLVNSMNTWPDFSEIIENNI